MLFLLSVVLFFFFLGFLTTEMLPEPQDGLLNSFLPAVVTQEVSCHLRATAYHSFKSDVFRIWRIFIPFAVLILGVLLQLLHAFLGVIIS